MGSGPRGKEKVYKPGRYPKSMILRVFPVNPYCGNDLLRCNLKFVMTMRMTSVFTSVFSVGIEPY